MQRMLNIEIAMSIINLPATHDLKSHNYKIPLYTLKYLCTLFVAVFQSVLFLQICYILKVWTNDQLYFSIIYWRFGI